MPHTFFAIAVRSATTVAPQALALLNNEHLAQCGASLAETLDPANIAVYNKRSTGEKFLINPSR